MDDDDRYVPLARRVAAVEGLVEGHGEQIKDLAVAGIRRIEKDHAQDQEIARVHSRVSDLAAHMSDTHKAWSVAHSSMNKHLLEQDKVLQRIDQRGASRSTRESRRHWIQVLLIVAGIIGSILATRGHL